ncbi:MAG: AAA family ATPase [Candidatus Saccharibacteria bacterium]
MIHNHNVKIIAFVGLAGSGKSTAADYIVAKGYPKVYFGGVVLNLMREAGIEDTPENEKNFREELKARDGDKTIIEKISGEIHNLINAGQHRIIADGLYSWTEYKALKHEFAGEITVVAIIASKKVRHHRLLHRVSRPLSQFEADQRDWDEIEHLEKGGPIAIADHFIMNDGDQEELHRNIDATLLETNFES